MKSGLRKTGLLLCFSLVSFPAGSQPPWSYDLVPFTEEQLIAEAERTTLPLVPPEVVSPSCTSKSVKAPDGSGIEIVLPERLDGIARLWIENGRVVGERAYGPPPMIDHFVEFEGEFESPEQFLAHYKLCDAFDRSGCHLEMVMQYRLAGILPPDDPATGKGPFERAAENYEHQEEFVERIVAQFGDNFERRYRLHACHASLGVMFDKFDHESTESVIAFRDRFEKGLAVKPVHPYERKRVLARIDHHLRRLKAGWPWRETKGVRRRPASMYDSSQQSEVEAFQ